MKPAERVEPGQVLEIAPPVPGQVEPAPESIPLEVLYEDSRLLVIDKPAGLVVHPAPGHRTGTLVNALLARGGPLSTFSGADRPGIVHRLDKETSGVMVVAKDDAAHRFLSRQFADGRVRRVYLAWVQGRVEEDEGTIKAPVGRHPVRRQRMTVRWGSATIGKRAVTRFRVLLRQEKASFLELLPRTGRTHQLRVHLKHIGHPILGDARYGVRMGWKRQALHARCLELRHPDDGRWMKFISPCPEGFPVLHCLPE